MNLSNMTLTAIPGIPLIKAGDDLTTIILDCASAADICFRDGDVLVVAQKIISKAEGRVVHLDDVEPSDHALAVAAQTGKDPRLVEIILSEARAILRWRPSLIIVEHRLGWVCANAGVDRSNVAPPGQEVVLLLPEDPDHSARQLRDRMRQITGTDVAVIITDTHGRPFRLGAVGVAIGVAGLTPLADLRGHLDLYGYELRTTMVAVADELASAASLLMGQADEGRPVVLVRGAPCLGRKGRARDLQRAKELDLFR
jgi:coenzyme F420-0:L-glutamate ligase/coenzyme F420-1:gamma-L-glutamate ligase